MVYLRLLSPAARTIFAQGRRKYVRMGVYFYRLDVYRLFLSCKPTIFFLKIADCKDRMFRIYRKKYCQKIKMRRERRHSETHTYCSFRRQLPTIDTLRNRGMVVAFLFTKHPQCCKSNICLSLCKVIQMRRNKREKIS